MITLSLKKRGPIINWLIRNKIVKNVASANILLLVVIAVCISITYSINKSVFASPPIKTTYIEDIPLEIQKTLPSEILKNIPSRNAQK